MDPILYYLQHDHVSKITVGRGDLKKIHLEPLGFSETCCIPKKFDQIL
jgi:hypothetical protein